MTMVHTVITKQNNSKPNFKMLSWTLLIHVTSS